MPQVADVAVPGRTPGLAPSVRPRRRPAAGRLTVVPMTAKARSGPGVRRIHIIGGPGSGKSTLARDLGAKLRLPVHELDAIAYEGPHFQERPLAARLGDVRAIADRPEWIVEGIHLGWTDALLERADVIVWLDHTGWWRAAVRIVNRFMRSAIHEARAQTGSRRFSRFGDYRRHLTQLGTVLLSSREYYQPRLQGKRYPVTRRLAEQRLRAYGDKVVRCRTADDVAKLVSSLVESSQSALG